MKIKKKRPKIVKNYDFRVILTSKLRIVLHYFHGTLLRCFVAVGRPAPT